MPDSTASVKVRREQARLRALLAGGRAHAACALCGHVYPMEFLVAAHIKKRSLSSDDEHRDLQHVAMLACTFGCDSLYESGGSPWTKPGSYGRSPRNRRLRDGSGSIWMVWPAFDVGPTTSFPSPISPGTGARCSEG